MTLNFKVGTHPARHFHVCRLRKPPIVGETFMVVDKAVHGSKPFRVHLTEIKTHIKAGEIYFVELM